MKKVYFALLCVLLAVPCTAETIIVDWNGGGDYTTIQDAINYSSNGDTIIVKPGTYDESIHYIHRAITITSDANEPNAVQSTIISASSGYSVNFDWYEDSGSVLTGLTISGGGIYGASSAKPTITGNIITSNTGRGIDGCHGLITNNIISENNTGIAYCDGVISNNIIRNNSASYGGGLYYCDANVVDNVIANNYASENGGGFHRCDGNIAGNIIVSNTADNDGGGLYDCGGMNDNINNNVVSGNAAQRWGGGFYYCGGNVCNNTIAGNRAERGGAINNCSGYVRNNIIAFNRADYMGGIYGSPYHSYNIFWENEGGHLDEAPDPTEGVFDPYFAVEGYWDSNGTPEESDDFWVIGDYHVKSQAGRWDPNNKIWVTDTQTSPCIDYGYTDPNWIDELWPHGESMNIGAYGGTTQASMSQSGINNTANLTDEPEPNDWVGYDDLKLFSNKWLCKVDDISLADAEWLTGDEVYRRMLEYLIHIPLAEDLDRDGIVNLSDYAIFASNWEPMPLPPEPNIMTWETEPYAVSQYEIAMVATTATSTDGSGVEYYFKNTTIGGHDSGWQVEPNYTDSGLSAGTSYGYIVQARNISNQLENDWSVERFATTLPPDETPPQPDPAEWQVPPYANSSTSIRMVAKDANDPSGVQYYFECTECFVDSPPEANDPNLYDSSDWQESSEYEVTVPEGQYSFVVRVRDMSPAHNTTGDSNEVTVDLKPPTPDPMEWEPGGEPERELRGSDYWAVMTAAEATDDSGYVEYYFGCTSHPGFSSGWITERTYEVELGISHGLYPWFHVKARDLYGNETAWSPLDRAD